MEGYLSVSNCQLFLYDSISINGILNVGQFAIATQLNFSSQLTWHVLQPSVQGQATVGKSNAYTDQHWQRLFLIFFHHA